MTPANPDALPDGHAAPSTDLELIVSSLARIGYCSGPTFSPDGGRLAFVSTLSGLPQVWALDVPARDGGAWPHQVTALDDQVSQVEWSPAGDWLAFRLAPGGGLNEQIYIVRPDGRNMRRLTEGGSTNNWLSRWTPDGRSLMVASNRRTPDAMDAYLLSAASGEFWLAAENNGIGILEDVSRDGRRTLLYFMRHRSSSDLFLLDLQSGEEWLLTPHEGPGIFDNGRFGAEGRFVYLRGDKDRERAAFMRVALADEGPPGEMEMLAGRDDAELERFELTPDGDSAALVWNVGGRSELAFYDLATGTLRPGPELPAEIVTSLRFSPDGQQLALAITGATAPRDIWLLPWGGERFMRVTHTPHPGVDLALLVRPELVTFAAHDGLPLSGWLYRVPARDEPGPLVLSFHGGPEAQERPYFNTTYQALLSQGIGVFAPNVRGSSGFGKRFSNLDNGARRWDAVRDIESCIDYVVDNGLAAPGRIGIMGGSYGGYMTMMGLAQYPERLAAGANICGVVNFETFFEHTEGWMATISTIEYGDPATEAEMLRELSPIHHVSRVQSPTIVLHGANDTNVPVVEAEQVVQNLQARDVPVKYVLFEDEGHGFRKTPNRIQSVIAIVRWFVEYL